MKRAVLIVNPYSTNVTGDRVAQVEDALRAHVEVQTEFTRRPLHATELAEAHSRDADGIVVFSGDGTYNEALNGVYGNAPVGFLPGGGTSVLPRALGLPRDPVEAAHAVGAALAEGRTRSISLGCVNGRRFSFSAGVGFDGEAVRRINELGREPGGARPGDWAFIMTFARMVLERRARWEPRLEIEGFGRAAFVLVANCDPYTYAGDIPLHVAPRAQFELGIDFIAPRHVRPRNVPKLVAYLVRGHGRLGPDDVVSGHDLDRLVVHCDEPLPLQSDGEDLGDVDEVVFEASRGAVSVLV